MDRNNQDHNSRRHRRTRGWLYNMILAYIIFLPTAWIPNVSASIGEKSAKKHSKQLTRKRKRRIPLELWNVPAANGNDGSHDSKNKITHTSSENFLGLAVRLPEPPKEEPADPPEMIRPIKAAVTTATTANDPMQSGNKGAPLFESNIVEDFDVTNNSQTGPVEVDRRAYPVVQTINERLRNNQLVTMNEATALMKLTRGGGEIDSVSSADKEDDISASIRDSIFEYSFSMNPIQSDEKEEVKTPVAEPAGRNIVPITKPTSSSDGPPRRPNFPTLSAFQQDSSIALTGADDENDDNIETNDNRNNATPTLMPIDESKNRTISQASQSSKEVDDHDSTESGIVEDGALVPSRAQSIVARTTTRLLLSALLLIILS